MEAAINYLAISVDLDGIRAEAIKKTLAADIQAELTHPQALAYRIKEIVGRILGSLLFAAEQGTLQPPEDSTDIVWDWETTEKEMTRTYQVERKKRKRNPYLFVFIA